MSRRLHDPYETLHNRPKWGFVIYRCDYRNDESWKAFIDKWSDRVKQWLLHKNASHLVQTLEFTVKEDPAVLDGATVEDVQGLFTTWTTSEEATAEQRAAWDNNVGNSARHYFCIHVDAQSLDGCLRYESLPEDTQRKYIFSNRDPSLGQAAYVNIVEKFQEVIRLPGSSDNGGNNDEEDDEDEDDEVISIKMHMPFVLPDAYIALSKMPNLLQSWAQNCEEDGVCLY
ncbi:hypothetical protein P153DRAFT_429072 [Dothidotthia symphoricarpi CBS 119687]|uniref:Uncharacterized protein n=1 Tax=Dothidotthia symphoricarpi CBS 119687 TaxID=1392245 RepID=A0A6A6AQ57_9PLEO|nr:uncharacterized protein P153DRAFT_429072 [Dothidotthia symphoricarpi CBS 119687]KAF2133084.1 hypothetical protein P153DRAFT_429072 [Dothidotthia symphoricarpi CBS 119687]